MEFKVLLNSAIFDFLIIFMLICGISLFRTPPGARKGNRISAIALLCAVILVVERYGMRNHVLFILTLLIGSAAGLYLAKSVNMIQIPSMVAFQHGAGGVAAFLLSFVELTATGKTHALMNEVSGILGLVIGAATFSASMIASGKLSNKLKQTPQILPFHSPIALLLLVSIIALGTAVFLVPYSRAAIILIAMIFLSVSIGIVVSIRIGGADMPVLISFLNASAGLAAAFCGIIIENKLLIAFGATVTASGSILTLVMCKAMNRSLFRIFVPKRLSVAPKPESPAITGDTKPVAVIKTTADPFDAVERIARASKKIIIIPGYGMAIAQAQEQVARFAKLLADMGIDVRFAIHPVAGRMPGHMNVLLAEAEVEYDLLYEMDSINQEFKDTDMVLIVGACDVVNPSAVSVEGTPISGMPILRADEARNVVCCNFDTNPGYSGVQNLLYNMEKTILLLGDAKQTLEVLNSRLQAPSASTQSTPEDDSLPLFERACKIMSTAKKVIIVPGYGMALAQAQFKVAELAGLFEQNGVRVDFAVHPVAGRMPGHMHVLLAEAEVDYSKLKEMDDINPEFKNTDLVIVIGACDVINPSAVSVADTPISGMPILTVDEAENIIICNYDSKPGYSGVDNPIYDDSKTICLFGDAKTTVTQLVSNYGKADNST